MDSPSTPQIPTNVTSKNVLSSEYACWFRLSCSSYRKYNVIKFTVQIVCVLNNLCWWIKRAKSGFSFINSLPINWKHYFYFFNSLKHVKDKQLTMWTFSANVFIWSVCFVDEIFNALIFQNLTQGQNHKQTYKVKLFSHASIALFYIP